MSEATERFSVWRQLTLELLQKRHLASPERGVPTPLADGIHIATADAAEPLLKAAELTVRLHASDMTVANGFIPISSAVDWEGAIKVIGVALLVERERAIGDLMLAGPPGAWDTISNVWTAHEHRRRGVARRLLTDVRERYPICQLQTPFTTAGRAWVTACAPDLLDVTRNSPCPCGSGLKFKRCHGGQRESRLASRSGRGARSP